jgi:hypothetical protein
VWTPARLVGAELVPGLGAGGRRDLGHHIMYLDGGQE